MQQGDLCAISCLPVSVNRIAAKKTPAHLLAVSLNTAKIYFLTLAQFTEQTIAVLCPNAYLRLRGQ